MDDNSVYRTLFFEETDDHLQQLNDHVLALESNPQDTALLNDIFRSAHTLKGMAATMGYDVMTQLTHKMENIFELFKTATLSVTSDSISLIFKCLDRLSELVEDLREEKELQPNQITDLLLELDQVEQQSQNQSDQQHSETTTSDTPLAQLSLAFEQLDSSDLFVIEQAVAGDYHAFSIAVRLEKDSMLKGPRAFLIMEKLEQSGDILHTEPSAEQLEEGDFDSDFRLVYLTQNELAEVQKNIASNSEIEEFRVEPFQANPSQATNETLKTDTTKEPTPKTKETMTHHASVSNQSIRVDLSRLDSFLDLVSELVVYRNQLEDVSHRENIEAIKDPLEQVSHLTSELQDLVLRIRMQQVNVVFSRFPRMVRDLSTELGKEMDLVIIGEETELDKTVVSELSEPLVHLLRNSVDHGIESPEEREALGKSRKGTIRLAAYQEGNRVIITLEDDGKGLDPQVIKASAERKGLATEGLSDEEIQQLIFHPGFSTAEKVTNISGRGVGMDAVQSKIANLGGTIELWSRPNKGTRFTIKLPLTLSIIQALMVRVGTETFAIPLDLVERVVIIKEEEVIQTVSQEVYRFQEDLIPIIRTDQLLGIEGNTVGKKFAIIVNSEQQYYGLLADELVGQQEIVIKKIDPLLQQLDRYQGATILGNGSIALILDVNAICGEKKDERQ
ncbi:chemotaxis protein CheA [Enterococcus gallinarum]|uniref:Chemotaxis protein CheA n=1 Tax=Enterococcus gallinarum TaxID=1353 RepID=A0ABD4HM29_ENTGA|nr:chemotaxis protein CheA [Enterococcus gallinarum]MBA0948217.1 chemotaxis protein CheA [Enterococcus gallinarum]MBA0961102.1 chemotaxis protein CheA [Enterococcus gallinarum]MBA0969125.1 chemotaxis protein CheA [Enterococcus gallinarum]MBA0972436.1 chemotaxis protein CheA [Enterococcus gallinarum]MCR1932182.1 chemotaxis protein CheA [Enterococcus gallinarum]